MTLKSAVIKKLVSNGMFEQQAKEVMILAEPTLNEIRNEHGVNFENEYPPMIVSLVFLQVKPIALRWIERNAPKAWFKPMFE